MGEESGGDANLTPGRSPTEYARPKGVGVTFDHKKKPEARVQPAAPIYQPVQRAVVLKAPEYIAEPVAPTAPVAATPTAAPAVPFTLTNSRSVAPTVQRAVAAPTLTAARLLAADQATLQRATADVQARGAEVETSRDLLAGRGLRAETAATLQRYAPTPPPAPPVLSPIQRQALTEHAQQGATAALTRDARFLPASARAEKATSVIQRAVEQGADGSALWTSLETAAQTPQDQEAVQRAVSLQRQQEERAARGREDHALQAEHVRIQRQFDEALGRQAEANLGTVTQRVQARQGGGEPLPAAVQRHLEAGLNADLSRVRVHQDAEADGLAGSVGAKAFTSGADIYFRRGQYDPQSREGLELIAHETAHVQQQARGQVGPGLDPDAGLEAQAQRVGARLASQPLRLEGVQGKTGLAPLTTGHAIQRKAAPPSWKVTASPEVVEQKIKGDMALFLRHMLGNTLLDQTHHQAVNRTHPGATPPLGKIFLDSLDHLPVSAASKRRVLDAAILKTHLPDWVRIQIAGAAVQAKRTNVAQAQKVVKALQAKAAAQPDHALDFGGAVVSRLVDTVVSLLKLAKFAAWDTSVPRILVDPVGYKQMWVNTGATVSAIVNNPGLLWDALTKDVRNAWEKGERGKALGYLTFDVGSLAVGGPGVARGAATAPGKMKVVVAVAKDASGQVTTKVTQVGDDLARGMAMTADDLGGGRTATAGAGSARTTAPRQTSGLATTRTGPGGATAARSALPDPATLKGLPRQLNLAQRCTNWADVAPFVGKPAGPTRLPSDYLYAKVPLHGGGFAEFAYLEESITGLVPKLKRDKAGNWQPDGLGWEKGRVTANYRLAQKSEYDKTNPPPPIKASTNNHHMTPDNIMRGNPLFQEVFERGLRSPDRASNMLHLAVSDEMLKQIRALPGWDGTTMSDVLHYTSHPKYDDLVEGKLSQQLREWRLAGKLPLDPKNATDKQLLDFTKHFDDHMRARFFHYIQELPRRPDGSLSALPEGVKQA